MAASRGPITYEEAQTARKEIERQIERIAEADLVEIYGHDDEAILDAARAGESGHPVTALLLAWVALVDHAVEIDSGAYEDRR